MVSGKVCELLTFVRWLRLQSLGKTSEISWGGGAILWLARYKTVHNPKEVTQPANPHLLVVDDDRDLCHLVTKYLEAEGFTVSVVHTGAEGIRSAIEGSQQLIVLDVMLPDQKGFDVLREIRMRIRTPVLMLTAKGDEFDRILGLELGADDYLPKPFSPRELVARIAAILRRSGWQSGNTAASRPPVIRSGDIDLDLAARTVLRAGELLRLTSAEFDLLHAFLESPGQVLNRESLVETVLGRKFSPFDRSIDLHVSNLRRKLGPQSNGDERIRSVRGIGYLYVWPLRATESCLMQDNPSNARSSPGRTR
jgi:DNA-binding response OmpR family regulator